jgi:hypothetical protein
LFEARARQRSEVDLIAAASQNDLIYVDRRHRRRASLRRHRRHVNFRRRHRRRVNLRQASLRRSYVPHLSLAVQRWVLRQKLVHVQFHLGERC